MLWETVRLAAFMAMFLAYRLRAYGQWNVPAQGPVLLLCNHQSYLDLLALGSALPHRHFHPMARRTLFRNRWFGGLIRGLNAFEVDQERGDIRAIRRAIELLKAGYVVLLFPEGSRTPDGAVHRLQEGVMVLIRRVRPTIVPVAVEGAYDAWPIWRKRPRIGGPIATAFGAPIASETLLDMETSEAMEHLGRTIDDLRLGLRAKLRHQTGGRYPLPSTAHRSDQGPAAC